MRPEQYKEKLDANIQKMYKKANEYHRTEINTEAKKITEELEISDRVETMAKRDCFITLKDHKPNFDNAPTCRLISPTKLEIGRISKQILQRIVKEASTATKINLWRNTRAVLDWFNSHRKQTRCLFRLFWYCWLLSFNNREATDQRCQIRRQVHRNLGFGQANYYACKENTVIQQRRPVVKERRTN